VSGGRGGRNKGEVRGEGDGRGWEGRESIKKRKGKVEGGGGEGSE
jgi:hypothetical protein